MKSYLKHQIIASICVAIFIICTALIILVLGVNRVIYERCVAGYEAEAVIPERMDSETINTNVDGEGNANGAIMTGVEAKLYYNQLSKEFASFFSSKYSLPGYDIASGNVDRLNRLKVFYRLAWVLAVVSLIVFLKNFVVLSNRRLYMPFCYGGALAALLTSVNALFIMCSHNTMIKDIRNMILRQDYRYFIEGDILKTLLPPEFARGLAIGYIFLVLFLILLMILIRWLIIFSGRPHKF